MGVFVSVEISKFHILVSGLALLVLNGFAKFTTKSAIYTSEKNVINGFPKQKSCLIV